jgi:hypothetical protein
VRDVPWDEQLVLRAAAEPAAERVARRARERRTTIQRLWLAMDRMGVIDDADRVRFVCRALWPDLRPAVVDMVAAHAAHADGPADWRLERPTIPEPTA